MYSEANQQYKWALDLKEIASIFRAGCVIRAQFLEKIIEAFEENPKLNNMVRVPKPHNFKHLNKMKCLKV